LLLKRLPDERWSGLWDFVRFAWPGDRIVAKPSRRASRPPRSWVADLPRLIRENAGVDADIGDLLTELRHGVTRFRITLRCYRADWRSGEPDPSRREFRWVAPARFGDFPLSTTGRKLARIIQGCEAP
jgi:A/G-specific adenine glycosylase